jgi:SAM-dependent methyltransferase
MELGRQMEAIYRELSPSKIPWCLDKPPDELVRLIESGRIQPCDAVDLGCGAGSYAVWLASRGFQVTGIDLAPAAIELAERLASERGASCRFVVGDLLQDAARFSQSFDFAYDWELLHHIFPEDREIYVRNVHRMLRPGGRYFSVCFSEEDLEFGGEGKYRETRLGTVLYFSSEEELRALFEQWFKIHELRTLEVAGKYRPHLAVAALMEREP